MDEAQHSEQDERELLSALAELHLGGDGAALARQLVSQHGPFPAELDPQERLGFFQELSCMTDDDFGKVIGNVGGMEAFLAFLAEEAIRRSVLEAERIVMRVTTKIDPKEAFRQDRPSASRIMHSEQARVRFPRLLPVVCPAFLRCKAFLTFHEIWNNGLPQCSIRRLPGLTEFLTASNQLYPTEHQRCDVLFEFLKVWLNIEGLTAWNGQAKAWGEAKSKIDVAFFCAALQNWPFMIIEVKNEAHSSTKADPLAQSVHYYLQQLDKSRLRGSFNAPAIVLQIVGTHVSAHAVIHSGHDILGPGFVGTHLLAEVEMGVHSSFDDPKQRQINAFWVAVKTCTEQLVAEVGRQLVIDLARFFPVGAFGDAKSWRPAFAYPWIVQLGDYRFEYVRAFAERMVFLVRPARAAHTSDGDDEFRVVKFVSRPNYAREAHELLANSGFAPVLYHCEPVGEQWTVVLMQFMKGMTPVGEFRGSGKSLTDTHRENEKQALDLLHTAGFVHGDLRDPNVLVDDEGRVCILDFDWAGLEGEVRYPFVMNPEIPWPDGAAADEFVRKEHDLSWFERRYGVTDEEQKTA